MYIVTIENNGVVTEIHGAKEKLVSGNIVKGINAIDSFSFSLYPSNVGFDRLQEYSTLVKVYNTRQGRYEYYGRVLYINSSMDENGLIVKEVTCESWFGFLCDSMQTYVAEQNWTVKGLLQHIIDTHNAQIESYKQFKLGEVTVSDPNDNLYLGIQRTNTWDTLNEKLIDTLGGEMRFRVEADGLYIDYLTEIGETKATPIALSRNMKSITKEHDPTAYVTRLIPLGAKLSDDTEERLDISSVNDGKNYIDDTEAIAKYGLRIGYKEWDHVTTASILKTKGEQWLAQNNKLLVKYRITALDLSLLGLDYEQFELYNKHPVQNALLGIDDVARITKQSIDVCEEVKSTIEVGDNFKTLTELQIQQDKLIQSHSDSVSSLKSSTSSLGSRMSSAESGIKENEDQILLKASKYEVDELGERLSSAEIQIDANNAQILLRAYQTEVDELGSEISEAYILIDGMESEIELKADKIALNGYVTATQLETEFSNFESGISDSLYVSALSANNFECSHFDFKGYGMSLNSKTFLTTGTSLSVTSTGGTVTGVTLNKKSDTIYYMNWE